MKSKEGWYKVVYKLGYLPTKARSYSTNLARQRCTCASMLPSIHHQHHAQHRSKNFVVLHSTALYPNIPASSWWLVLLDDFSNPGHMQ